MNPFKKTTAEQMHQCALEYRATADALQAHSQFGSIANMTEREAPQDLREMIRKYLSAHHALGELGITAVENIVPAFQIPAVISGLYKDLRIEPTSPRDGDEKQLLTYDKSLARLQKAGYQRHLRPAEAFSLLADNLEGKLDASSQAVAQDMLSSYGEWLSLAMERKGDTLVCHFDPQGLEWNGSTYVKTERWKHADRQNFSVAGKSSQRWIDLNEFGDELVQFLYGRSFTDLPEKMKNGDQKAQLYLPPEGVLWPAGRGCLFYVYAYFLGASRGGSPSR